MKAQASQQPRRLEEFESDTEWFYGNIEHLKEYEGKFVAVKNHKIIASDKKVENVVNEVENLGENPSYLLIEFVHPEGTAILL